MSKPNLYPDHLTFAAAKALKSSNPDVLSCGIVYGYANSDDVVTHYSVSLHYDDDVVIEYETETGEPHPHSGTMLSSDGQSYAGFHTIEQARRCISDIGLSFSHCYYVYLSDGGVRIMASRNPKTSR